MRPQLALIAATALVLTQIGFADEPVASNPKLARQWQQRAKAAIAAMDEELVNERELAAGRLVTPMVNTGEVDAAVALANSMTTSRINVLLNIANQLINRLIHDLKVWSAQAPGYRRAQLALRSIFHDAAFRAGDNLIPRVSEDTSWAELKVILEDQAAHSEVCRHVPERDRKTLNMIGEILKKQIELGDGICAGLNGLVEWASRHPEIDVTPLRRFRREPRIEWVEPTLDALEAINARVVTVTAAPLYLTYYDIANQCGISERMVRDRKKLLGPPDRKNRGRLRKAWLAGNSRVVDFIAQHRPISVQPASPKSG